MKHFKIKNIIQILFFFIVINCQGNIEKKSLNIKVSDTLIIEKDTPTTTNNKISWELIDVTRFFDKPIEDIDLENFKKIKIQFSGDTLILGGNKAIFSEKNLESTKYFGKGSLYEFFTEYILKNFNINIKNNVHFIELSDHDNIKKPFNYYFLKNGAIYENNYLFLYNSDDYVLAFKKQENKKNLRDIYTSLNTLSLPLKYSLEFIDTPNKFILIPEEYKSLLDLKNFNNDFEGIALPKTKYNIKPLLILANDASGQSILYLYTLSDDYNVLDKLELYYSYDIDEGNIVTTFNINENYKIQIKKTEYKKETEKILAIKNYLINRSGKFEEIKNK
ncbi:hypothetical protein ETU10_11025 [Apibacter muscae]|uniref:hypothetical protein n=1 Tax=Apibacter muscae TaxID=2509004 RepID=UPI0011ACD82F|nr:hypothetical protein [Apibacter muscae]TWP22472.1 hypothetical protein ETU10_11025 [Apibacter muscae]